LFVAANSKLWYSGYQRPFEHRQVIRYFDATTADPSSPGSLSKDGEIVQAVVPLGVIDVGQESVGSPPNSAASVHFLTDRGFYRVSGFDAISLNKSITVAPHGTKSPFSVARSRNMMYWLDDQLQVRSYSGDGGPQPLSMYRVDDYTRAVTVPSFCVGWSNRDRYYLMLTSTQILVWNEDFQEWESLDVPDSGVTNVAWGFSTVYNNLQRQMLFRTNATTNGIYEHDRPEATGNVAFAVTFRGLTAGYTATIIGRAMWVNCDGYTSGTLTTTRTTSGVVPAGTASSSISLNTTGSRTWAYDALGTGVGAYEIVPGLSGTVPSNWTLYGCGIQSEVVPVGPSR
jgi:hypothetical protein